MHAGDMDGILSQQFSADWARVAMKQRFVALIGRSDKDRMAGASDELQAGALFCVQCSFQNIEICKFNKIYINVRIILSGPSSLI